MKQFLFFLTIVFLFVQNNSLLAQQPDAPVFGKDIMIHFSPGDNQRNVTMCSAFNGWLFASYSYTTDSGERCSILKSVDGGINWSIFMDDVVPFSYITKKISLTITGNNIDNLRLIFGTIMLDTNDNTGHLLVNYYKIETFSGGSVLTETSHCRDIALISDYSNPAIGSNPNSFGILYSKTGSKDTIVFYSSDNGYSLTSKRVLALSSNYFGKVSLDYGWSLADSTGRYYAVWEEKSGESSTTGHIYTAHSEPGFDSPFTTPVCLDSLDASLIESCRNPVIACQHGEMNNESSDITTVILVEKEGPSMGKFDIQSFYNKNSTMNDSYIPFTFTDSTHQNLQPSIAFNPYDSSFAVTWYDSTAAALPYIKNDVNLSNPGDWEVVSAAYNDDSLLSFPRPQIFINPQFHSGSNTWIGQSTNDKGVALFDACYSTYTQIPDLHHEKNGEVIIYPNPASDRVTFDISKINSSISTVYLVNLLGQKIKTVDNLFIDKSDRIELDISDVPSGTYLYEMIFPQQIKSGKLVIIK